MKSNILILDVITFKVAVAGLCNEIMHGFSVVTILLLGAMVTCFILRERLGRQ